ncbi:multiple epidermal growth factor-like domains protein 11, partial [Biomphalaria pfeifferi]
MPFTLQNRRNKQNGFVLEMLDSNNATLYRYQDDSNLTKALYSVLIKESGYFAARVSQQQTTSKQSTAYISLYEFEAYG